MQIGRVKKLIDYLWLYFSCWAFSARVSEAKLVVSAARDLSSENLGQESKDFSMI